MQIFDISKASVSQNVFFKKKLYNVPVSVKNYNCLNKDIGTFGFYTHKIRFNIIYKKKFLNFESELFPIELNLKQFSFINY